jgi:DNA transformation protein
LRNLGPVSERWLAEIGIADLDDLRRVGVVEAYLRVRDLWDGASLNLLYALEGAVEDISWQEVSAERKRQLRDEIRFGS